MLFNSRFPVHPVLIISFVVTYDAPRFHIDELKYRFVFDLAGSEPDVAVAKSG